MSRPTAAGRQSTSAEEARARFLQTTPQLSPVRPGPSMHPLARDGPRDGAVELPVSLPPLRQLSSTPPTPSSDRRVGNPLGVHSILNPQAELLEQQRSLRRRGSQTLESPSPIESHPSQSLPSISRPTSVDSMQGEPVPPRAFQPPGRPPVRHGFPPRSPTLHRTQSLGILNPTTLNRPTGTIDAHQSPFLSPSGRPVGSDPVVSQPALPTPPVGGRATYFPTVPPTAPTPPPSMVRDGLQRQSINFPQSGSASPIATYSPYSQPASVASSQFEPTGPQGPGSYVPAPGSQQMPEAHHVPLTIDTERSRIAMGPSGQSSIQIMTIQSQQGHRVQIPVDVQAASKVADEKRKRNAGASARFRARRKEKEREANLNIQRLQQQLRDADEDVEFYKSERDYFKSIVFQQPGAERHYARPPSPRLRRLSSAPSNAPSSTTGEGSRDSPYSGYDEDPQELERNVRRRTSNYHPATGSMPTSLNGPGPSTTAYATPAFPPVNAPPPASVDTSHSSVQSFDSREHRPLVEPQQSQRPVLRDPFASEPSRFDRRSWGPTPGSGLDNRG